MGMHVVVVGNPVDGIQIIGPFKTLAHAMEWAEEVMGDENYWLTPLEPETIFGEQRPKERRPR